MDFFSSGLHPTTLLAVILTLPLVHSGTRRLLETWWAKLKLLLLTWSPETDSNVSTRAAAEHEAKPNRCTGPPILSGIFIYPVKSTRATEIQVGHIDRCGLVHDRRFMLVCPSPPSSVPQALRKGDGNPSTHRFISQRQCPALATVTATYLRHDLLRLSCTAPHGAKQNSNSMTLHIGLDATSQVYRARLWDNVVSVMDMGDRVASFFQEVVGETYPGIRLTRMIHPLDCNDDYLPAEARTWWSTSPKVALTDGFPILVACQASLDEINHRLKKKGKEPIPMSRFRPNIVISNTEPFEEDMWKVIQIGNTQLHIVKGCPRCKQSCTDQETGTVHDEPLTTLADFRAVGRSNDDVYFAQNAIAYGGPICKGATVRILKTGQPVWDKEDVMAE